MKEIATFGGIQQQDGIVRCEKCGRQVDEFIVETPIAEVPWNSGFRKFEHTGEVIITVRCHGETWRASNRRGKLPA